MIGPVLHVARFTLEAVTPLSLLTGDGAGLFDTSLVRDANGLPTIPATSLAGVLRSLYQSYYGEDGANALFGFITYRGTEGQGSRIEVSFGCVHDATDRAVEGLLLGDESRRLADPVLVHLRDEAPLVRHHVAITMRGAAKVKAKAKFDRTSVPVGTRFSFELALWGNKEQQQEDQGTVARVLGLINAPDFRLGGATRRGLGCLRFVVDDKKPPVRYTAFDMTLEDDRRRFVEYRKWEIHEVRDRNGFEFISVQPPDLQCGRRPVTATLTLKPVDFWRIGSGDIPLPLTEDGKSADQLPVSDPWIVYTKNKEGKLIGSVLRPCARSLRLPVPASAIKGALAHRAEFHHKRLNNHFAGDAMNEDEFRSWCTTRAMDDLLGSAKDRADKNEEGSTGVAGAFLIDDAVVTDAKVARLDHNSIDRFSGGVRNGLLYSEEALFKGTVKLQLTLLTRNNEGRRLPQPARQALAEAIDDLCTEQLSIGAGDGDGLGYCKGKIEWSDGGAWLKEETTS